MGSPLSPLLAEIFMSKFEEEFLKSDFAVNIFFWFRYVDDILVCFTGSDSQLTAVLDHLNSIHNKINFTIEKEENNSINFLDLKILKENNSLKFDIFRKPTFTDVTIPKTSVHPMSHKLAAYGSMVHRAFFTPLDQGRRERELDTIRSIAVNNGFSKADINRIIRKKQKNIIRSKVYPSTNQKDNKFLGLTFFGPISNKIANVLRKGVNKIVAFRTDRKLSQVFFNAKHKIDKRKKSGVYRLTCEECNACYIGQTGRNFDIRYKEHHTSFRLNKRTSNFSNHFLDSGHSFPDITNLEILHCERKGRKLDCLESIEIYKHNKSPIYCLLNVQIVFKLSVLFGSLKQ